MRAAVLSNGARVVLVGLIAAFVLSACKSAEDRWLRVPDPDEQSADAASPRMEDQLVLPPFPVDDRLLPFDVGGVSRNTFFVDPDSIRIGEDWAIRFSTVIVSPSGARSVTYEGLDCTDYAYKLYAIGRADGTWSEVKRPEWRPITFTEINRYRIVLFKDFFCPKKVPVRSSGEAIRALKAGAHSRADDSF